MSIDPRNDRIVYFERILNAFVNADGLCNIRGAAEKIVELEEDSCIEAFEAWLAMPAVEISEFGKPYTNNMKRSLYEAFKAGIAWRNKQYVS